MIAPASPFSFPIGNYQSNSAGTVYIVEVNDGSPPMTFVHPPPDSITHTFYEPSCGYNTVNFQNAFQVQIRAVTPCQPPSVATVEPIYISDPPTAAFEAPPRICLGETALINDQSWGSENALNGCDTNVTLVWEISPGNYNLQSGFLGDRMGSYNAGNWLPGSPNLGVRFTEPGLYTVRQYVGNQAGCEIDTVEQVICVDSIPEADFGFTEDTLCLADMDTVDFYYLANLVSSCDTTDLRWSVTPNAGHTLIGDRGDSAIGVFFSQPGQYTVSLTTENICGVSNHSVEIIILASPQIDLPDDYVQCGTANVDFSQPPFQVSVRREQSASMNTAGR
ncbi:MAG: hypothetical protein U5L96_09055 [Owenweeksia sp.]|nr:hypothetical protein [Owenweeksia sp.]